MFNFVDLWGVPLFSQTNCNWTSSLSKLPTCFSARWGAPMADAPRHSVSVQKPQTRKEMEELFD